jgi:hypothetical protein
MLSQFTRCAKNLCSCLSSVAKQLYQRITQPARSNMVTGTLADLPRRRVELLAENALLRQRLIVLHRRTKTPRLTWRERLSLLFFARWDPNWKQVLRIIKPDTLLRWHREGFRLFWRWKSRVPVQTQPGRLALETIALIERMARENPLWGGGTRSRRIVEVGNSSRQTDYPEVHAGGALETADGAILVDDSEDARERHLGL